MKKRGLYIVCEGIDGSGKSSIMRHLWTALGQEQTTELRMPGGTGFAEEHRNACRSADIDDTTQVLFYAALNRDVSVAAIEPELEAGRHVVSDRGWISTLVYQTMQAEQEKLLLKIVESPDIPVPDLVIYLNLPLEVSRQREGKRLGAIDVKDLQASLDNDDRYSRFDAVKKEKVKEGYDIFFNLPLETNHYAPKDENLKLRDDFAVMWKLRPRLAKNVIVIDANRPLAAVTADAVAAVLNLKK